jgi:hypothetical protein
VEAMKMPIPRRRQNGGVQENLFGPKRVENRLVWLPSPLIICPKQAYSSIDWTLKKRVVIWSCFA